MHPRSVMIHGILASSSFTRAFRPTTISSRCSFLHRTSTTSTKQKPHPLPPLHATPTPQTPPSSILTQSLTGCFRPTTSDVDRISYGKPARQKGTGSRGVPHRLNADERTTYDRSRGKGYLEVIGSSYRRERRGSPLLNTWRSFCDAKGWVCITMHKGVGSGMVLEDEVVVDLSPMRLPGEFGGVEGVLRQSVENLNVGAVLLVEDRMEEGDEDDAEDGGNEEDGVIPQVPPSTDDQDEYDQDEVDDAWQNRPIHQLSPYCVSWVLPRSEAKVLCKHLATIFDTKEAKATKSRKPKGVKPGKNRRSGGYGIG